MTVTLVRVVQTSLACPSQWDAWDADGQYYYLRYRHAHGTVHRYSGPNWCREDEADEELRALEDTAMATSSSVDLEAFQTAWGAYWRRYNELYLVADFEHGHEMDGCIELTEFARLAGIQLSEDLENTDFDTHFYMEFAKALRQAKAERDAEA